MYLIDFPLYLKFLFIKDAKLFLIVLIAFTTAAPLISVEAEAAEADVLGTFSVSVEVILISSVESPSSLAAICEILVIKPCPISIPP